MGCPLLITCACRALTMQRVVPGGAAGSGQNCSFRISSDVCEEATDVFGGCDPGIGTGLPPMTSASMCAFAVTVGAAFGAQATSASEASDTTSSTFCPAAAPISSELVALPPSLKTNCLPSKLGSSASVGVGVPATAAGKRLAQSAGVVLEHPRVRDGPVTTSASGAAEAVAPE